MTNNAVNTITFARNLLTREMAAKPGENVLISPLSVSVALGMTANGARNHTLAAMTSTLGIDSDMAKNNQGYAGLLAMLKRNGIGVRLDVANAIFARIGVGFSEEFQKVNEAFFGARVEELNFDDPATLKVINGFVSEATNKKISAILNDPIAPDTVMFLINCVYFKGEWTVKFDKSLTGDKPFATPQGEIVVPTMYRKGKMAHSHDWQTQAWEAINLPFGESEEVRFLAVLPAQGKTVADLLATVDDTKLLQIAASSWKSDGELWLPRIDISYDNSLRDSLVAMGMADAFGNADFSGMRDTGRLFIQDVKHKTVFKVDEEGAEGAAVTSVSIGLESLPPPPFAMHVDRPFLLAVVDTASQAVIFVGAVNDPTKK